MDTGNVFTRKLKPKLYFSIDGNKLSCNTSYTMKFISVLVFTIILTVSVGILVKNTKIQNKPQLVSPLVAITTVSSSASMNEVFINNYYGYKIKHPSNVDIKNERNGDVSFQKSKSINISITQSVLAKNDTINTIMETVINAKNSRLKDKFSLINTISPISISSATAQTYTSVENGENVTYYYVPQNDRKYLLITNYSPQNGSVDFLTSEDIIYSLEFLL